MSDCADILHLSGHNTELSGHNCSFYPIQWTLSKIARTTSD
ncbi:hypothetical protein [Sporosarcina sp. 6E9]|nr:hypothetical protein [Sporosarcina sp. 6E9]